MSIVNEAIKHELRERVALTQEYVTKRNSAKTQLKRKYYTKKIVENNTFVHRLVEAINRLEEYHTNNTSNAETPNIGESE